MKKIFELLRLKWADYLLEVIVIMIGILGAFTLNNWNDIRKIRSQKEVFVQSLINDLAQDTIDIDMVVKAQILDTLKIFEARKRLVDQKANMDTLIQVAFHFNRGISELKSFSTNTYDALISTGNMDLFEPELTTKILNLNKDHKNYMEVARSWTRLYRSQDIDIPFKSSVINKGPLFQELKSFVDHGQGQIFNDLITIKLLTQRNSLNQLQYIRSQTKEMIVYLNEHYK